VILRDGRAFREVDSEHALTFFFDYSRERRPRPEANSTMSVRPLKGISRWSSFTNNKILDEANLDENQDDIVRLNRFQGHAERCARFFERRSHEFRGTGDAD